MIQYFLSPRFLQQAQKILLPISCLLLPLSLFAGLYFALFASPTDYQQGDIVRIMYIHVPAAWMSLAVYSFIAICSFSVLVWKTRLSYIFAVAAAPIGAIFALITLTTGSIWGKPVWGTWWVWDARLTSMLILFLQYIAYWAIVNGSDNLMRAERPASVIAVIGLVNIPIVKFSVDLWHSLHQPSSFFRREGVAIHPEMLKPLLLMFLSFILYFLITFFLRVRNILSQHKQKRSYDLYSN